MLRTRSLALMLVLVAAACADPATSPLAPSDAAPADALGDPPRKIRVLNTNDAGPGSLRAALQEATDDPAVVSVTLPPELGTILVQSPLTFSGSQAFTIDGNLNAIDGSECDCDVLVLTLRSSITLHKVFVNMANRIGVKVIVPEDATGTARLIVAYSTLTNGYGYGLVMSDVSGFASDDDAASETGSAASLRLELSQSYISNNARDDWRGPQPIWSTADRDAVRVIEGGEGDVYVGLKGTYFGTNGHDDVHVEERGSGSVDFRIEGTRTQATGVANYSTSGNIGKVVESGAGNLSVRAFGDTVYGSRGRFIDARENGTGDLSVSIGNTVMEYIGIDASRINSILLVEDDAVAGGGNLLADIVDTRVYNVQAGQPDGPLADSTSSLIAMHEKGDGLLDGRLTRTIVRGGIGDGLAMTEEGNGNLRASVRQSTLEFAGFHGISLDERGGGDLVASVSASALWDNGGRSIRAIQQPSGAGSLTMSGMYIWGNLGGDAPLLIGPVTLATFP